jgi:hypothetical protein
MPEVGRAGSRAPRSLSPRERQEYGLLLVLERLESLVEEMEELGVESRAEAEARIRELHSSLEAEA